MTEKEKTSSQSNLGRWIAKALREAPEPIYVIGSDGKIAYANDAMADWLKLDLDELIGLDCSQTLTADADPMRDLASMLAAPSHPRNESIFEKTIIKDAGQPVICLGVSLGGTPTDWLCRLVLHPETQPGLQGADWSTDEIQRVLLELRRAYTKLDGLHGLAGSSAEARRALAQCQIAADTNAPVLISGPIGAGKGEAARAIFLARAKRLGASERESRLYPIDCRLMDASLMRNMLEMIFECHAPFKLNVVLLERVDMLPIESHELLSTAMRQWTKVQWMATCRSSTPLDVFPESRIWRNMIVQLSTQRVDICSLAERAVDLSILIEALMPRVLQETKRLAAIRFSQDAMSLLQAYPWPNNVRELRTAMQQAVSECEGNVIEVRHLPIAIRTFANRELCADQVDQPIDLDAMMLDLEREMIETAIRKFPRNRAAAAQWLGISRSRLLRRLEQLGLASKTEKPAEAEDVAIDFVPQVDAESEIDFRPAGDEETL